MSDAMSNYLEAKLINHVLRNTAFTTPGTSIYVGLIQFYESATLEAGTLTQEVSGGDYGREGHSAWDDPSGVGATENTGVITFPTATANWGWISGVIISDAATAGNVLLHGALTTPRDVVAGDIFKFNDGDLDISFT